MKINLFRVVLLALALAAAGCTKKDTRDPDDSGPGINLSPVASAGPDQTVGAGELVTLAGSGSDPDGTITAYNWSQVSGASVTLSPGQEGQATFTAPQATELLTLVFELRVSDNGGATSPPDSMTVFVVPVREKFLGTAIEHPDDLTGPLTTYFNQVTPGNAGKWGSVEGTRDQMDWTTLDSHHTFAESHELRFKHHTLVWGQQQPGWLAGLDPLEQLDEVDEWIEALADRYGNLDMIDVVNEPLHAPPAYKEALGGDGDTGWDWVINAFALARAHFPESTLILNDYNILNQRQNTLDYLELIALLQAQELIDGIGVQAHFLEQTSAATVKANLDLLAATGLPIYASELDINFADDARHANKLRELFTVFWEHPAVAGITHWGYRQGAVWRTDAWLLNDDGSERPGLSWLHCYAVEGNDDCDHLVPEYVPAGWAGSASGLTLEAELFDEGEGVAASGSVISDVNLGDWIAFKGVEFQEGWDGLTVRYAKGEGATGRISLRLDCEDVHNCAEVASIPLPPTGGWGNFSTVSIDWAPRDTSHDVYLRFMDVAGVGNIDWLRFAPSSVVQVNLVNDGSFENGTAGWEIWWDPSLGELEQSSEEAMAGEHSLRVFNRLEGDGNRPALDVTSLVAAGETLEVSVWAMHTGPGAALMDLSYKQLCNGGEMEDYPQIAAVSAAPAGEWVQFSGEVDLSACDTVDEIKIFFQNTPISVENIYIDEVELLGWRVDGGDSEPGNLVEGDFEGGQGNWHAGNAEVSDPGIIEVSNEQAYSGEYSLKAYDFFSSGADSWGSYAAHDLTGLLTAGTTYSVSAQVMLSQDGVVTITREINSCENVDPDWERWSAVVSQQEILASDGWTQLSGEFEVPEGCVYDSAQIYFEHTAGGTDVYIDDVSLTANN